VPRPRLFVPGACLLGLLLASCSTGGSSPIGGSGGTGAGGSGPCRNDQMVVQQLVSTEVACSLSEPATQCANVCDLDCAAKDFDLGSKGSGCAMEGDDTAYCRCVCEYCRAR
jgi:hypothetical protein